MERDFIITNEDGLHARPATLLVSIASKFECDISVTFDGITVDLKSIMNVLSLGLIKGSQITIRANGIDEIEALNKITKNIMEINLR